MGEQLYCRFWNDTNPLEIQERTINTSRKSYCVVSLVHIFLRPKLAISINDDNYRSIITNFLWSVLDEQHTNHTILDILSELFESIVVLRGDDVN